MGEIRNGNVGAGKRETEEWDKKTRTQGETTALGMTGEGKV